MGRVHKAIGSKSMISKMNRCSPLHLGHRRSLRNRVVIPAMASSTADAQGFATEATFKHYERLGHAGVGLINVEYSYVCTTGRSELNQLGAHTDAHIPGLQRIAEIIKGSGALAGLQITHCGGKSTRELTGGQLMAPSDIPVPVKDRVMDAPTPMDHEEIAYWRSAFIAAADRAVLAGFDLLELHCAHGYGLNQWLSPLTNRRLDSYGGDLLGRARLVGQVITAIRARHPHLLLAVRHPGQDFVTGGLSVEDSIQLAQKFTAIGVDVIDVSSGLGGWRRPTKRTMQGYLIGEAARIQASLENPVIGVGGIEEGAYIDHVVGDGTVALAAVGRAILKDPEGWNRREMQCAR